MIKIVRQNYKKNVCLFNNTKDKLTAILGNNVIIDHIGSTAIPKMSGKNIIDIVVGVPQLCDIENTASTLEQTKFYRGTNNSHGDYIFFASRKEETKSGDIHIHVVMQDSERFNDFISIKQYLLNNPKAVKEYTLVKHKVAELSRKERSQYKTLKSEYMNKLIMKAREYTESKKKSL